MNPVAREWDHAAAGWNRHGALIHDWLHNATQQMLDAAHIERGARVLDVAAGAGDQTMQIASRVGTSGYVLATDVAPRILDYALENARAAGFSQVSIRIADAQSLNLAGANFDAVVCRLGLMFCTNPLLALEHMFAALKPGGRCSVLVFAGPEHNPCLTIPFSVAERFAGGSIPQENPAKPGTLMSLGVATHLQKLFRDAGFSNICVEQIDAPFHAPNTEHYISFLRDSAAPLLAALAVLTSETESRAWSEIAQALQVFETPLGWRGPKRLLLCSGLRPAK
jgi:ubiquinone/menaquinone biosynthesis C-methylase UbiE